MNSGTMEIPWVVAEEDRAKTAELARELELPRIAAHLLVLRGMATVEEAKRFLNPSLDDISDPFLLTDMRAAVARITQARDSSERVLVFGDYDVDGISGTVILVDALHRFGIEKYGYGMPSRVTEGYGLSPEHVETAAAEGVDLIITVDNGINARDAANTARRLGIDLVVTDHHQIEGELPEAAAVVNPKRESEGCPAEDISGAGVAFKLATALTGAMENLDLVALGSVADIVPLLGENRALVALGLEDMIQHPRIGLVKLAAIAGVDIHQINSERIAFQLAPRLNAAGRLGDGCVPLELLMTDSPEDAARVASELDDANMKRRAIEQTIFDQAVEEIEATLLRDRYSIVLANRQWHPGVVGIVASRIQQKYNRPVVLLAMDEDGTGRGSGRSVPGFDLAAALGRCREHLIRFGGHAAAAGLTLFEDGLEAFQHAFEEEARALLADQEIRSTLEIDAQVSLREIDSQLVKAITRLEPFGCKNASPVFCAYGVEPIPHSVRELRGGHARFEVRQGAQQLQVIAFRMASLVHEKVAFRPIDIAFTPKFNTWRGETTVQLVLKDIHT